MLLCRAGLHGVASGSGQRVGSCSPWCWGLPQAPRGLGRVPGIRGGVSRIGVGSSIPEAVVPPLDTSMLGIETGLENPLRRTEDMNSLDVSKGPTSQKRYSPRFQRRVPRRIPRKPPKRPVQPEAPPKPPKPARKPIKPPKRIPSQPQQRVAGRIRSRWASPRSTAHAIQGFRLRGEQFSKTVSAEEEGRVDQEPERGSGHT